MCLLGSLDIKMVHKVDPFHPDRMYFYSSFCNMGNGCFRDTWSRVTSLPKQQIVSDLMSQSVKAINCLSCPLCHVKEAFCCLLPPFVLGIKVYGNLDTGGFSIH